MIDEARHAEASRRIDEFARRVRVMSTTMGFGQPDSTAESALHLASHAALAVAIDPELVHLLRINFFLDKEPLPYWIEARLLLSPLCSDHGDGLYVIDSAVRDVLLNRLVTDYGAGRLKQVAALLWQYAEHQAAWTDRRELRHAQQLTALSFLDGDRAQVWLAEAEHGSGEDALPKEWFVAIRSDLPTLPPVPDQAGDPRAVYDALSRLDFQAQLYAFRELRVSDSIRAFVLHGPPHHAQEWVLYRLLRELDPVRLFEVTLNPAMADYRAFDRALASAVGVAGDTSWRPVVERLVQATRTHNVVLAFHHVERVDVALKVLSDLFFGMMEAALQRADHASIAKSLLLFLVDYGSTPGNDADASTGFRVPSGYQSRVAPLPRIGRISEDALRDWLKTEGMKLPTLIRAPEIAASIMQEHERVPQRVLEQLCLRCGVRWPDVLALARSAVVPADESAEPMLMLAREYDETRNRMPRGDARTRAMEAIVARMCTLVGTQAQWPIETYQASASAGERLAAVAILQERPDRHHLAWLAERVAEKQAFVQFHALSALLRAVQRLPDDDFQALAAALREARQNLGDQPGTDRATMLRRAESTLQSRRRGALKSMPLLRTGDIVLFPSARGLFDMSSYAARASLLDAKMPVVVIWRDEGSIHEVDEKRVATIATVMPGPRSNRSLVFLQGTERARISNIRVEDEGVLMASVEPLRDRLENYDIEAVRAVSGRDDAEGVLLDMLRNAVVTLSAFDSLRTPAKSLLVHNTAAALAYNLANAIDLSLPAKQALLDESDLMNRLDLLFESVAGILESLLPQVKQLNAITRKELAEALAGSYPNALGLTKVCEGIVGKDTIAAAGPRATSAAIAHAAVAAAEQQGRISTLVTRTMLARQTDNDRMLQVAKKLRAAARPRTRGSTSSVKAARATHGPRRWRNGSTLRVKFIGGNKALNDAVMAVAREWTEHANLGFEVLPARSKIPAEIRVAFRPDSGSWSYVGTDARSIPAAEPTMNLGSLTGPKFDDMARRSILKEFGHALGLINEHQNPNARINWNRDAVVREMGGPPNHWPPEVVEQQIFATAKGLDYRPFDPASVMMFEVPASWTIDGRAIVQQGTLSAGDRHFIAELYPRDRPATAAKRSPRAKAVSTSAAQRGRTKASSRPRLFKK